MAVVSGSEQFGEDPTLQPGVVTIGNFDGVHLGHRALLAAAASLELGPVVAYTFDPPPVEVLRPDRAPKRLQTLSRRVERLLDSGADTVVVEPFDRAFASRSPESFATEILQSRLRARAVVVGWDFHFGKDRGGDPDALRTWLDVPVRQVEPVLLDGKPISSSRIRKLVAKGDVGAAARLLDRPHIVHGTVVHGDARGRTLGFPTANLATDTPLLPADGVYAVRVDVQGRLVDGVANVGTRPTFAGRPFTVEVHLLDFDGDLYGQHLAVHFVAPIRDEQKFSGVSALKDQIGRDIASARQQLGS